MLTEQIELSEEDCRLLDTVRKPEESYIDAFRRLLAGVVLVDDIAAENNVQHPYENDKY